MNTALTIPVWIATLERLKRSAIDDTTRTLVQILLDIIDEPNDVDRILDTYGRKLLGP